MEYHKKVKKNKVDKCNICGEVDKLTWEDVPPRSCGNSYHINTKNIFNTEKYNNLNLDSQNSVKYRTICANCNQKLFKEKDIEQAFLESLNELIVDKANVIETVISNLEEVIKKRKDDITPEQIDRQIELKQRDLMALIQGISTMDTYKESQQIMNEIENLKTQKTDAILLEKQRSRDLYRTEDLRKLLNKEQQFTEFQPHIFKQLIDKILIDGNKATFVFTNMVKITKILP